MQATYSSVNKSVLGIKSTVVALFASFTSPFIVLCGVPENSTNLGVINAFLVALLVFINEYTFLKIGLYLNNREIRNKINNLDNQIAELEELKAEESDEEVIRDVEVNLVRLKKEKVKLISTKL